MGRFMRMMYAIVYLLECTLYIIDIRQEADTIPGSARGVPTLPVASLAVLSGTKDSLTTDGASPPSPGMFPTWGPIEPVSSH